MRSGLSEKEILIDESAPDHLVTLHAEVMNAPVGGTVHPFIYMRYALHAGVGMRQCFESMQHVEGIAAVHILRSMLDEYSIENLWDILREYRDSIVELSAYRKRVGVLKWNTLFWEVRNYSWILGLLLVSM